ncbi:MAG: SdrD B-like domain-containing protein, partial [Planctomycetota bacterium]
MQRRITGGMESLESRQLLAAISGAVFEDVNLDGIQQDSEPGIADIQVYLDENANGQFETGEPTDVTNAEGIYAFTTLDGGDYIVRIVPGPGLVQVNPSVTYAYTNIVFDDDGVLKRGSQLVTLTPDGVVTDVGRPTENRMDGLVRIADGSLIAADFKANAVFRVDPNDGEIRRIGNSGEDIVGGLAYDPVGNQVLTLVRPSSEASLLRLARIDVNTAETTSIGIGRDGLETITDITFDLATQRVIGFDDFDDEFVAFDLLGGVETTSTVNPIIPVPNPLVQPDVIELDSDSITIAGPEWLAVADLSENATFLVTPGTKVLMFDEGDRDSTQLLIANVDTGEFVPAGDVDRPLMVNTLSRPRSGNVGTPVSVT